MMESGEALGRIAIRSEGTILLIFHKHMELFLKSENIRTNLVIFERVKKYDFWEKLTLRTILKVL